MGHDFWKQTLLFSFSNRLFFPSAFGIQSTKNDVPSASVINDRRQTSLAVYIQNSLQLMALPKLYKIN